VNTCAGCLPKVTGVQRLPPVLAARQKSPPTQLRKENFWQHATRLLFCFWLHERVLTILSFSVHVELSYHIVSSLADDSDMIWVCPSWDTRTDQTVVDLWVKISSTYYCNVLLTQKLLSATHEIPDEPVIFQQDSASTTGTWDNQSSAMGDICINIVRQNDPQQSRSDWPKFGVTCSSESARRKRIIMSMNWFIQWLIGVRGSLGHSVIHS